MEVPTPQHVRAKIYFLEHSKLYETEKPYSLEFDGGILPSSNLISHKIEDLLIHDLRGNEDKFNFEENGFAILDIPSEMEYHDFDNLTKINDVYCPELAAAVMKYMGAKAVQFFDAQVSYSQIYPSNLEIVIDGLPRLDPQKASWLSLQNDGCRGAKSACRTSTCWSATPFLCALTYFD